MKSIGTAVAGGMLSATFIDLFYIPLFFVLISRAFKRKQSEQTPGGSAGPEGGIDAPPAPEISRQPELKQTGINSSEGGRS
jgi:hypothetical protein